MTAIVKEVPVINLLSQSEKKIIALFAQIIVRNTLKIQHEKRDQVYKN